MSKIKWLQKALKTTGSKVKSFFKWYKGLYRHPWYVKCGVAFATLIVAFIMLLVAVDINFLWLFGDSPSISQIRHPKTPQASEVYSADGVMIGKFFKENRTPAAYNEINPMFFKALVDTEDERFEHHIGIDFAGMMAAAKDYVVHHDARGASTITQQLAKNMFRMRSDYKYSTGLLGKIPGVKLVNIKMKEWITAIKLEAIFSKREIITMYANTVDFGSNAYGIKTAAKTYFGKTPKELTTDECAVLVGMLKATTFYNPRINPENSKKRRNTVIENLLAHHHLTKQEAEELKEKPIKLDYSVETTYDGQATYFREAVAKYLKQWCEDNGVDLYTAGYKIYTTIDTRMQKYAEAAAHKQMAQVQRNFNNHWGNTPPWQDEKHQEIPGFIEDIAKRQPCYKILQQKFPDEPDSVEYYMNKPHTVKLFDYEKGSIEREMSSMDSIRYMVKFMHCGFVAVEPQTGHVKAWVGDIDFDSWKYDKVTADRQPGSTFKLFVYTEAMQQGLTPCDRRQDSYISMKVYDAQKKKEVTWAPTNANGYFTGDSMPLKTAFAQSINSVAVKVGLECGISNVAKTAYDMGLGKSDYGTSTKTKLDETPSLSLGSSDVKLLELVNSYATISNKGKSHDVVLVTRIVDSEGKEIYTGPTEENQVISTRSAFLMQQMLQAGMREAGGTSMSLWGFVGQYANDTDFGGKTGTSNNHSDAWFVGVSKNLVCGAWVGGEYRCIHFRTGALGQGSRTALPICGYFLQSVLGDPAFKKYHGKFDKPEDDVTSDMYNCTYQRTNVDTLETDTIVDVAYDILYDEDGNMLAPKEESDIEQLSQNPQQQSQQQTPQQPATIPVKKQEATEPKE